MLDERTKSVPFARTGIDAVAVKPAETDLSLVLEVAETATIDAVAVDYEGRDHVPDPAFLESLAASVDVRLTIPVRADGFDPLGDDSILTTLPDADVVGRVLVAGHPAYLTDAERTRAIAPRLAAALETAPDAWVGTENVERVATATGAAQYDLLTGRTERELRALRAAGFDAPVAVYAPTVFTADPDRVLDAVGPYVARREPVARRLPEGAHTDSRATGPVRETLLEAAESYALVGTAAEIGDRVDALENAGATTVVAYPAEGLESVLERAARPT